MRFAFSRIFKCLLTAWRVISNRSHKSASRCPFSRRNSSSNFRRLSSASALKTSSTVCRDNMQPIGCMSTPKNPRRFPAEPVQHKSTMKLRSRMLIGAIVCVVAPGLAFAGYAAYKRRELQATRQQLVAEGFKTELSQFEIACSPEANARGEAILKADFGIASTLESNICAPVYHAAGGLRMETSNSVVVPWKEEFFAGPKKRSPWPAVHQTLEKHRLALEAATAALMEGPIG